MHTHVPRLLRILRFHVDDWSMGELFVHVSMKAMVSVNPFGYTVFYVFLTWTLLKSRAQKIHGSNVCLEYGKIDFNTVADAHI